MFKIFFLSYSSDNIMYLWIYKIIYFGIKLFVDYNLLV